MAWCESHAAAPEQLFATLLARGAPLMTNFDLALAITWIQRAAEISRRTGPAGKLTLIATLSGLGWIARDIWGDFEQALARIAEAEAAFHELEPGVLAPDQRLSWHAGFAQARGEVALKQGQYADAKRHAAESIRLYHLSGSPNVIDALIMLGTACLELDEFELAEATFAEALQVTQAYDTYWFRNRQIHIKRWLGLAYFRQGDLDQAHRYLTESLRSAADGGDPINGASGLGLFAGLAARQGQADRAARLAGASSALYGRHGRKPWEDSSLDTLLPGWRAGPDQAVLAAAYAAGQALTLDAAVALALDE